MGRSEEDFKLYHQWAKTKSKTDFQTLYRQMLPLITRASRKASYNSNVPQSVFKLEAAQQFHNAITRFKPELGWQLSTYVHKTVEDKLKRVNTTYQNIARIVERRKGQGGVFEINKLLNAEAILMDRLNRPPTDVEISEEIAISPENIGKLRDELRKDLSLNETLEDIVTSGEIDVIKEIESMAYYDLPPEAQLIYDYSYGLHGKVKIAKANGKPDWERIARTANLSNTRVSKIRKIIARELNRY